MANDLNQCQFIGRLGKDPEIRHTQSGEAVASFTIVCGWKSKDKEGTEWINCSAFGKLAEICGQYLKKGSQVYVSGRFNTRKWQDKDGQDRYSTQINVDQMQMLGRASTPAQSESDGEKPAKQKPSFDDIGDDIPFN